VEVDAPGVSPPGALLHRKLAGREVGRSSHNRYTRGSQTEFCVQQRNDSRAGEQRISRSRHQPYTLLKRKKARPPERAGPLDGYGLGEDVAYHVARANQHVAAAAQFDGQSADAPASQSGAKQFANRRRCAWRRPRLSWTRVSCTPGARGGGLQRCGSTPPMPPAGAMGAGVTCDPGAWLAPSPIAPLDGIGDCRGYDADGGPSPCRGSTAGPR
jgi:hypothetical protein